MAIATDFETMVLDYQDRLYRFALRLTGSPADAEDVAQDAFVRAYRWLQSNPEPADPRPWLYRVALNVVRNRLRGRHVATQPLAELDFAADEAGPPATAERDETRAELACQLAVLPRRYREAVVLRHVEDLSYPEMAEVLGRPLGSVKSDVHRGLALLRAALTTQQEYLRCG